MIATLASLIILQQLDTAAEAARKRLSELPAAEQAIVKRIATAQVAVESAKSALAENQQARRDLEKQVAAVDARLSRFDDHKAAVKTNHEYTALLHEIETAKTEKDGLEGQILELMESADLLQATVKDAERALVDAGRTGEAERAALVQDRAAQEAALERLTTEKQREAARVEKAVLAKYEQLLKQRKMLAVAEMQGDLCMACHVRLRPAVTQNVRRNAELVACDSCQRILYFKPAPTDGIAPA